MSLYEQPNLDAGLDQALISITQSVPMFPVMILVFTFFVILLGGSANQKRKIGTADYPFWAAMSGVTITIEALIMTLGEGMINLFTLGIVISVAIMCGVWFFMSKQRGEL